MWNEIAKMGRTVATYSSAPMPRCDEQATQRDRSFTKEPEMNRDGADSVCGSCGQGRITMAGELFLTTSTKSTSRMRLAGPLLEPEAALSMQPGAPIFRNGRYVLAG